MAEFRKFMDGLPLIAKIILALPVLDILWAIYRICRGDTAGIVLGVLWIIIGSWTILWLVDLIMLIIGKPVFELSDKMVSDLKDAVKGDDSEETKNDSSDETKE